MYTRIVIARSDRRCVNGREQIRNENFQISTL
jgi:hypothetical protein